MSSPFHGRLGHVLRRPWQAALWVSGDGNLELEPSETTKIRREMWSQFRLKPERNMNYQFQ